VCKILRDTFKLFLEKKVANFVGDTVSGTPCRWTCL